MMLKNEDKHLKKLAKEFCDRYKQCNYNELDAVLFIRRLNNMGYVVVLADDLQKYGVEQELHIKKYIVPWHSLFDEKKKSGLKHMISNAFKIVPQSKGE